MSKRSFTSNLRQRLSSVFLISSIVVAAVAVMETPVSAEVDTVVRVASPSPGYYNSLSSVSCVTASFCLAVGSTSTQSYSNSALAATWNGTSWTEVAGPSGWGRATDVDCVTSTFCMVTGVNSGNSVQFTVFNGSSFAGGQSITGPARVTAVACGSTTFCVAVGSDDNAAEGNMLFEWNGSTWTDMNLALTPTDAQRYLNDVECYNSGACVAVVISLSFSP